MRALGLVGLLVGCGGGDGSSGCPSFATITGGTFTRSGTDLVWTLSVEQISELTFNKAGSSVLEYRWSVELDSDRNNSTDLRVAVSYFARNGEAEMTTTDILGKTQEDVWAVASNGGASSVGSATATLANNTFTLMTNDREEAALANVTDVSQSTWMASYFWSLDDNCTDTFKP